MNADFPRTSRYHGIETAILETPTRQQVYLKRRFLPPLDQFPTVLQEHVVTEGDRLDNLAYRYLGDPEQFWRICDANGVMRPAELVETIGQRWRITLPEGLQGVPYA